MRSPLKNKIIRKKNKTLKRSVKKTHKKKRSSKKRGGSEWTRATPSNKLTNDPDFPLNTVTAQKRQDMIRNPHNEKKYSVESDKFLKKIEEEFEAGKKKWFEEEEPKRYHFKKLYEQVIGDEDLKHPYTYFHHKYNTDPNIWWEGLHGAERMDLLKDIQIDIEDWRKMTKNEKLLYKKIMYDIHDIKDIYSRRAMADIYMNRRK